MQASEMQKFVGTGSSHIHVSHEPISDAARKTRAFALAEFDGADSDSSHIQSLSHRGIHIISERDYERRDDEGSAIFLYHFEFHNVILLESSGGLLTYTGWLTSARCYDNGGEPPKEDGRYQWLPPHSAHFTPYLPSKVKITVEPKR